MGQDMAQKVTFSSPAASAKNLLAELSRATGVTFSVSPQTQGEILLVDVKDVPLSELMKRIAQAAAAEWKQEGESFRLIRTQALQNQQEREYLDARALRFKADQARIQQEISNLKPLTQAEAQKAAEAQKHAAEEIMSGREGAARTLKVGAFIASPPNRLLLKLLTAISPADLARIAPGTRMVLSSLPTRMQRSLPGAAGRYINEFMQEYQTWLSAQPPAAQNEDLGDKPVFFGMGGGLVPMQGGLGKVLLILTRNSNQEDVNAQIRVADGHGNIVADQMRMLMTRDNSPGAQNSGGASNEKPIEVSQQAKEHAAFMNQSPSRGGANVMIATPALPSGGGAARFTVSTTVEAIAIGAPANATPRLPVSPEWMQKLVHPEKNEPLGFAASELFLGAAKARGENIVASLPDSALLPLSSRALQQIAPSALLALSQANLDLKVESADGWLMVMPKFPAYVREIRVDRVELQRLLTAVQKEGRLTLDNISRYASSRANPAPAPAFDSRYVNCLFQHAFQDFNQATFNWRMLQLYATLGAGQRQNLGNGGALSLGALSPKQHGIVASMVYDDMAGPMFVQPMPPGQPQRSESREFYSFRGEGGGSVISFGSGGRKLIDERTEFLPTGVPSDGVMTVRVDTQEAVYATRKDGTADPRFFTAQAYGAYVGMAPNIVLTGTAASSVPQYDTFRQAALQIMWFHFQLSQQASMDKELRDSWLQPGARDVPYGSLSDQFRARAEEMAKKMANSNATIKVGGGPPGVRPPSP